MNVIKFNVEYVIVNKEINNTMRSFGLLEDNSFIGIGPASDTLKIEYKGEITKEVRDNLVKAIKKAYSLEGVESKGFHKVMTSISEVLE